MSALADAVPNEEGTADVQWTTAPMSDAAYRRLLAILFGARPADADQRSGGEQR